MPYNPPRQQSPQPSGQPIEVDLVFRVRACGTCAFFWPEDPGQQPYGPYPAFDFGLNEDAPIAPDPAAGARSFPWLPGVTRPPAFPNPEVMDGCRKAPIMTIGINPNLTAFAPGQTGASWCYPSFSSDGVTDAWTKYAYYYRYRSVYQERFDLNFVKGRLLPDGRVVAPRAGAVVSAERTSSAPGYVLKVRYDGDRSDTAIPLERGLGTPRWVVLFDSHPPNDRFAAGDVIAARLDVPAGESVQLYREQVGYYEQFVPVLERFQALLRARGHPAAELRMGEDVGQLDMVACASPHWTPAFLGGSRESEQTIVGNCVSQNAWAMKQLVQTRPAVLFLVGESSYDMFQASFGALIERDPPLARRPPDGAFTLLRETTDPARPCYLRFAATVDGTPYQLRTRLVITPHFSYSTNFTPQIRLGPEEWRQVQASDPGCARLLESDPRLTYVPPVGATGYAAFLIHQDAQGVLADLESRCSGGAGTIRAGLVDAHRMMYDVLSDLYDTGALAYGPVGGGPFEALTRTEGSCRFCVNDRWEFPQGCPYGKNKEPTPAASYLEKVTAALVAAGRPAR